MALEFATKTGSQLPNSFSYIVKHVLAFATFRNPI